MTQTGLIYNPGTTDFAQNTDATAIYVFHTEYIPSNLGEVEIDHGGSNWYSEIRNIQHRNPLTHHTTQQQEVALFTK